jgi:hypothetical protein
MYEAMLHSKNMSISMYRGFFPLTPSAKSRVNRGVGDGGYIGFPSESHVMGGRSQTFP